jgi:zinc/manganese transport system substrate-binding protein
MPFTLNGSAAVHIPERARPALGWRFLLVALAAVSFCAAGTAAAKVRIAAAITDLGSIASSVGGEEVEVVAIARPAADPHRVEVLPSYMVRVSRAQVYLKVGLGLDQWSDLIVEGSNNGKLHVIDCSKDVEVLEKPTGKVDASMGDVHPNGNPHYWLDPHNAAVVARTVASALSQEDPAHADDYAARAAAFAKSMDALLARGREAIGAMPVHDILTYHRSWSYFANAFGLNVVATLEPIPGIPPTAHHLQDVVEIVRERKVPVAINEPYFSEEAGKFLARETGIRIVRSSAACDDVSAGSYMAHLDWLFMAIRGNTTANGD